MPENIRDKPVREIVDDMMEQSQRALQSSARATAELNELRRRADEAMDWREQLNRHSWLAIALATGVAALIFLAFSRNR
jgi:hypothetical protein